MSASQTQQSSPPPSLKETSIGLARPYVFAMSEVDGTAADDIKQKLAKARANITFANMTLAHPYVIVAATFTTDDIVRVEEDATAAAAPTAEATLGAIKEPTHIVGVSTAFVLKLMGELFPSTPPSVVPSRDAIKPILNQLFVMPEKSNIILNARQMGVIAFIHGMHAAAVAKGQMIVGFTDTIPNRYRAVLEFLENADGADVVRYQNLWADLGGDFMSLGVNNTDTLTQLTEKLKTPVKFMQEFIALEEAFNDANNLRNNSTEHSGSGIDGLFEDWMRGLMFGQMFRQNPTA